MSYFILAGSSLGVALLTIAVAQGAFERHHRRRGILNAAMKSRLRMWIESRQAAVCGLALGVIVTSAFQADNGLQFLVNLAVFSLLGAAMAWLFWRRQWNRKRPDQQDGKPAPVDEGS